jgi:hypothetical protein
VTTRINIAVDYFPYPAGRKRTDGPYSGQRFLEDHLLPALKRGATVVELDNELGYGSSFLEEAFGGLVRYGHFTAAQLRGGLLKVESDADPSFFDDVWEYIDSAKPNAKSASGR